MSQTENRQVPDGARLMRLATYASVGTASLLVIVKLVAWQLTGSLSLMATLIDSLLDVAASLVNLFAVRRALLPPDREHRFGFGKAEPLAAMGQSAFICGSAVFLLIEASAHLLSPPALKNSEIGLSVMLFSIAATAVLVLFQRYVSRHTQSLAIEADSLHYLGDILVNFAVIVALLLVTYLGWIYADPIFGIVIAGYILYNAGQIARRALSMLMDRELPEDERKRIVDVVMKNREVLGMHDLRTRASGPQTFIQCHVEMDGKMSLFEAHEVADRIELQLCQAFPNSEVIIHEDTYLGSNGTAVVTETEPPAR